jgi:hypothetical protein
MDSYSPTDTAWQQRAIEQIERLKASYFRALDAKQWDEFAALFAPECEFVTYRGTDGLHPKRRVGGRDIAASVRRTVGNASTVHLGQLREITFHSTECATAVWDMTDYAEIPRDAGLQILRGAGHYVEQYSVIDGHWMISRLELKRNSL